MQLDAFGRLLDSSVSETSKCAICHGTAERLSSAWQGEGIAYHNYQCRTERCPAAGTIVEHDSGERKQIGPVFDDRDLAVRLVTRDRSDAPTETVEGRS